jgi:hypothetical protein
MAASGLLRGHEQVSMCRQHEGFDNYWTDPCTHSGPPTPHPPFSPYSGQPGSAECIRSTEVHADRCDMLWPICQTRSLFPSVQSLRPIRGRSSSFCGIWVGMSPRWADRNPNPNPNQLLSCRWLLLPMFMGYFLAHIPFPIWIRSSQR